VRGRHRVLAGGGQHGLPHVPGRSRPPHSKNVGKKLQVLFDDRTILFSGGRAADSTGCRLTRTPPWTPVDLRRLTLGLALFTAACGGDRATSPSGQRAAQNPVVPTITTYALSGIVRDTSSDPARPLPDRNVEIWIHHVNNDSGDARGTKTDSQGRYSLAGVPGDSFVVAYAGASGYDQPCAATLTLRGDDVINLDLVNIAGGSGSSVGRSTAAVSPTLSGVVFETTAEGRRPIADAHVFFYWRINALITATTRTDATGHYWLCRIPAAINEIEVSKPGYGVAGVTRIWPVNTTKDDAVLDIELKRTN